MPVQSVFSAVFLAIFIQAIVAPKLVLHCDLELCVCAYAVTVDGENEVKQLHRVLEAVMNWTF